MLRRRRPAAAGNFAADDDDPKKLLAKTARARLRKLRDLATTLVAAIWSAVNPSAEIRSQEYSRFLTNRVKGLTIGWHIFRTITEGAFLATYGLALNTVVVQVFWIMSLSSVVMHFLAHQQWLRWREMMCVWTNISYGTITVLKIFHLVPRLPNENNYMFKHCFLTMADAAFSQTAVHKQYIIQFAEAIIRIIVWRRYNVLPDVPTWGVIAVSLSWQVWLLTFSAMLQARNVSVFLRERAANAAATAAAAAGSSSTAGHRRSAAAGAANAPTAAAAVAAPDAAEGGGGGYEAQQEQQQLAPPPEAAAVAAAVVPAGLPAIAIAPAVPAAAVISSFTPSTPTAAVARPASASRLISRPRRSHDAAQHGHAQANAHGHGPVPLSMGISQPRGSGGGPTSAQMRYLKALRSVARGPSSYVLLAHHRHQAGGQQCASTQFYIPNANPEMLPPNWRDRLAVAIAEGAPGWQLANACVRKGSLIVHLDLVYGGVTADGGEGAAGPLPGTAAAAANPPFPSYVFTKPYAGEAADFKKGSSQKVLEDYVSGMDAESLLELLGLSSEDPEGQAGQDTPGEQPQQAQVVSIQMGDNIRNLPYSASDSASAGGEAACVGNAGPAATDGITAAQQRVSAVAVAAAATTADVVLEDASGTEQDAASKAQVQHAPAVVASAGAGAGLPVRAAAAVNAAAAAGPLPPLPGRALALALRLALWPPADVKTPAYATFLSARVGILHLSYAVFMCVTALVFAVVRHADGISPLTMALFLSAELLTLLAHATLGRAAWQVQRAALVYCGVVLRTLQMTACTCGFLPNVLRDSDCESGRWVQKVVLITTLQALCLQPPVRAFFLVRLPSVLLSIYIHVYVCQTNMPLVYGTALHLGWEGLLFAISSFLQLRHVEAFRNRHDVHHKFADGTAAADAANADASCSYTIAAAVTASRAETKAGHPFSDEAASAVAAAQAAALTSEKGAEAVTSELPPAAPKSDADAADAAAFSASTDWCPAGSPSDPTDVSLSSPLVAMVPRRAAHLQLHFTCAPAVVDELQVVLRHINPAAMSSGVHTAQAVRDITHALVTPFGAAAAPPYTPTPFTVELTLVASPSDMPGLIHVELWRGRRCVSTTPVLLAAAPEPEPAAPDTTAAVSSMSVLRDCAARVTEVGGGNWLDDVLAYVDELRTQGHSAAADQFVEELGGWLAQAAAVERGLTAAPSTGGAAAPRVANVLYFHGYGSEFMYVKPRRLSNGGANGAAVVEAAATGAGIPSPVPADPLQCALRQLLLCQGSMLLAVSVEAGCVSLSDFLVGRMVGHLGATLPSLLEGARTPVTQLPLLHAAVKSGSARMVDLVAEWCAVSGLKDVWANEAAVLAVSLDPLAGGAGGGGGGSTRGIGGDSLQLNDSGSFGLPNTGSRRRRTRTNLSDKTGGDGDACCELPFRSFDRHRGSACDISPGGWARIERSGDSGACGPSEEVSAASAIDVEEDHLVSRNTPFKVVSFRSSQRAIVAAAAAAASPSATATDASVSAGAGGRASHDTGFSGSPGLPHSGCSASICSRRRDSLESLVEGGVVVLTPLHLSLVLGDEGRLASHILRTYPEAYELWRMCQPPADADSCLGCSSGPNSGEAGPSTPVHGTFPTMAAAASAVMTGAETATRQPAAAAAAFGADAQASLFHHRALDAFNSAPGLARGTAGGAGCGGGGGALDRILQQGDAGGGVLEGGDSYGTSMISMSLSEVAFLEGMRWVPDEPAAQKRGGFKVTRL